MKLKLFFIILFALFFSCKHEEKKNIIPEKAVMPMVKREDKQIPEIQFSEKELLAFMDSVAKLPSKPLQDKVAAMPDSIFRSQADINKKLSSSQFSGLKGAIKKEYIDIKLAKQIFGKFPIDSLFLRDGEISVVLFPFDKEKNTYNEFAVTVGWPQDFSDCYMYFFKSDRIVSRIILHYRYDLTLEHFKDSDGKTVVYYKENYESGSGIWWFNYYFYKYDGERLLPVLNELQNANMTWPGCRLLWLESTVVKTNPLTLKMVYNQEFFDTLSTENKPTFINDSTLVKYKWNEKTKTFVGDYSHSKISKAEILTYYLGDNELLFINIYYKTLKKGLSDANERGKILYYLNNVKNNLRNTTYNAKQ